MLSALAFLLSKDMDKLTRIICLVVQNTWIPCSTPKCRQRHHIFAFGGYPHWFLSETSYPSEVQISDKQIKSSALSQLPLLVLMWFFFSFPQSIRITLAQMQRRTLSTCLSFYQTRTTSGCPSTEPYCGGKRWGILMCYFQCYICAELCLSIQKVQQYHLASLLKTVPWPKNLLYQREWYTQVKDNQTKQRFQLFTASTDTVRILQPQKRSGQVSLGS